MSKRIIPDENPPVSVIKFQKGAHASEFLYELNSSGKRITIKAIRMNAIKEQKYTNNLEKFFLRGVNI